MVFLEHVGFGGRDRPIWLYYWDMRDGPEFCGWWITPDYIGNNEFFLQSSSQADTPVDCELGSWRSHNVEQLQLQRKLELGFAKNTAKADGEGLIAIGSDAATSIVPDNIVRITFSKMIFREEGMNHGKPCYRADNVESKEEPPPEQPKAAAEPLHPALLLSVGAAIGALAVLAAQRWTS